MYHNKYSQLPQKKREHPFHKLRVTIAFILLWPIFTVIWLLFISLTYLVEKVLRIRDETK